VLLSNPSIPTHAAQSDNGQLLEFADGVTIGTIHDALTEVTVSLCGLLRSVSAAYPPQFEEV
jgi:hypothetical protein